MSHSLETIMKVGSMKRSLDYETVLRDIIEDGDRQDLAAYADMILQEDSQAAFRAVMIVGDRKVIEYVSERLMQSNDPTDLNRAWTGYMHLGMRNKAGEVTKKYGALTR